ncbi:hypothetical protein [Providencia manganoxydans]|uniref:hypothetical protein n=1 Tax=Providencia manganoxydans TaxID=2923283 RepID=UPI0032DAFE97
MKLNEMERYLLDLAKNSYPKHVDTASEPFKTLDVLEVHQALQSLEKTRKINVTDRAPCNTISAYTLS